MIRHPTMHLRGRLGGTYIICRVCCVFLIARFICNYCTLSHTSYGFVSARALRCARAVVDSGAASSLSRSLEAGFFLLASCRLLVTSRGFVVSPALVHFLRLPSPPQFRSKGAADPTHARPPLSVAVEEYGKKLASFSRSRFIADFLPTSGYFPGLCVSPAMVNPLRLSSTPQFRSANTTDPTHAPAFRRSRGASMAKSRLLSREAVFLPTSCRLLVTSRGFVLVPLW